MPLILLQILIAGCGIKRGYVPDELTVYTGQPPVPAPAPGDSIRLVSWNIQYGQDLDLALAELRSLPGLMRADILLLQEMNSQGVAMLADSLGLHYVYSPAAVHPHHQELFGNAVLSRWPIIASHAEKLPHATPVTGHPRITVSARLDLGEGREIIAVSVHTATVITEQDKRLEQATAALDSLAPGGEPVILAGDFNTVTDYDVTQTGRLARGLGYRHLRLPPGPTIVNKYKKFPGSASVLDHVFYRGLQAGARGVARSAQASDHYPVWVVFATPPPLKPDETE